MLFLSLSGFLTWDNVEVQVGPHGPRWLHSQYWAGPQRCREWWMKTAVWSSPLPEDRSEWLRLCLHIWAEEGWQIKTKGSGGAGQSHFYTLLKNSHSGWKTEHRQESDDSSVSCRVWPSNILLFGCRKKLFGGIQTLWPGTTMCQMSEELMWKPGLV